MTQSAPPALTVRYDGNQRTFAPGADVVVGRDLRADMRIAHPLVSRAHLLLRFDQGRWMAIDNGSLNGIFVNGHRVPMVDIRDGQQVNLGNPDGPPLRFDVGRHQGAAGRPPQTMTMGAARPAPHAAPPPPPSAPRQQRPGPYQRPHPNPAPTYPAQPPQGYPMGGPQSGGQPATRMAPVGAKPPEAGNFATKMMDILRPGAAPDAPSGAMTLGRATDNDIVVGDVLASRHHAMLISTPLGTEIRDNRSINGTFVNGTRIGSAILNEGDVVTIGNVDLTFSGGTLVRRSEAESRAGGLEVQDVCFDVEDGKKRLLHNITLTARPGTLTAVIGPSGAGKSTLSRLIAGYTNPSVGATIFEGHNIHTEYASLRSRIGMVPQDDVVHRQLTVNQALGYAAELRLPPDSTKADRGQAVAQVLEELEMTRHGETRVEKLSGGQRKRASVALELLTGPSLLVLDEPTSGLDPALDRQVMLMLRALADAGRVVLVVTHSISYLDVCDQILLLGTGGKTAFCDKPDQVGAWFGTTNWAEIFDSVSTVEKAEVANVTYQQRKGGQRSGGVAAATTPPADLGAPPASNILKQLSTVARRQVRLIVSDRGYSVFLGILPFLVGALSLTVKGKHGLQMPGLDAPTEPQYIMVLLNLGAVFMGTALTIRDLVGERPIFKREQAVGLSTMAYLLAKIAVFCGFAIAQSAIATAIVLIGKKAPNPPDPMFGSASFSLFLTVAGTCVASAILGLALSSFANSNEQIMPMLVVSIMSQLVLGGGMIPVTGRVGLDQMSWITPSRWGYAAGASTIDFNTLLHHDSIPKDCMPLPTPQNPEPVAPAGCTPKIQVTQIPQDGLWKHTKGIWFLDMGMLVLLSVLYSTVVWWKIRLKR